MMWHGRMTAPLIVHTVLLCRRRASVPLVMISGLRSVSEPVVEDRYDGDLNRGISYHVDHGNGMDCYAVGPTLGGGTAALFPDSTIVYPYCYKDCEILDNGPLRFTS